MASLLFSMGVLCYKNNDFGGAKFYLFKSIEIDKQIVEVLAEFGSADELYALGDIYYREKNKENAIKYFKLSADKGYLPAKEKLKELGIK